jgi:hypothetical protein
VSVSRHARSRPALVAVPDPPEPTPDPARPLLQWLLAGTATFTVVSARTGDHIVIRIVRTRQPWQHNWSWFAWGRGGLQDPDTVVEERLYERPDGIVDSSTPWFYIGQLYAPADYVQVMPTRNTDPRGSSALDAINWVMRRVHQGWTGEQGTVPARLWKSIKCARCRRTLTDAESIARGLGPECWEKQGGGE